MTVRIRFLLAAAWILAVPALVQAQGAFPSRPIHMVVPFPAGGSPDVIGRYLAEKLAAPLGQSVVVENRAGANGGMGTASVVQSPADGYTLLMASTSPLTVNPALYANTPYDPVADLEPVILIGKSALVLLVNLDVPARDMSELLELARKRPGLLTYGSAGHGNLTHLVAELLKMQAKVDLLHVPYKGTAQVKPDLLAGRISMFFDTAPAAAPLIRARQVRAVGVTTRERTSVAPDIPTFIELGISRDFDVSGWFAVLAPRGTPAAVVERLNVEINRILASPEAKERFAGLGIDIAGGKPEVLRALMGSELARWKEVIKTANIKIE